MAALLVLLLFAPAPALCQTSFGGVNGTVSDSSGALVPLATVRLTNQETNIEAQTVTNNSGYFTFVNVRPGTYRLRIEVRGFKTAQVPDFNVAVGQTVTQNVVLEVGQVAETVEVTAETPLLQPSSADLGTVVEEKVVHNLPLNGRNFTQLMLLTPGVNPVSVAQGPQNTMTFQSEGNTGIPNSTIANSSIQGQQNRSKVYFFDGIINTSVRATSYVVLPDIDMIQEFKVQSHNDKAEYGGVTGGVVNMYSKSGTNDFHGSAFWYVRNDIFDARDPFRDAARKDPLPFRQNQFGANLGGPVMRNKTFFHGGYDGWRYRDVATGFARYPAAAELGGDFSNYYYNRPIYNPFTTRTVDGKVVRDQFPGNVIPDSLISPKMEGFLATYTYKPNYAGDPANNFQQTRSRKSDANDYQVKLDHYFGARDNAFFRWNEQRVHNLQPVGDRAANAPDYINRNYGGGWIHTFSPGIILEVRGGVATQPSEDAPQEHELGTEPMKQLGFKDIDKFDGLLVRITGNPWSQTDYGHRGPAPRGNPNYSLTSNLTWLRGNHNLKAGFQWVRIDRLQVNNYQQMDFSEAATADPQNAARTGDALASALLGLPTKYSGWLAEASGIEFWTATTSAFFQDEWKLRPDLTLTLGLRYDVVGRVHGKGEYMIQSGPDYDTGLWLIGTDSLPACSDSKRAPCIPAPSLNDIPYGQNIRYTGERDNILKTIKDNVGPRIGAAWQVTGKMVVRGGYGLQFDALPSRSQYGQHQFEFWGWPQSSGFDTGTINRIGEPLKSVDDLMGTFPFVAPPLSPWAQTGYYNDPDRKDPYSHQWHVEVQRQMTPGLMMSLAYVGSKSGRLDYAGPANVATTPGPPASAADINARRPVPHMSSEPIYSRDLGEATYNALQYKLQQRFSGGLAAVVSYTWSKSIDTSSGWFNAENGIGGRTIQDYYHPETNRAVSSYDVPHLLTAAALWDVPVGRGKQWLNSGPAALILGGWQINTVVMARSGQPFTPDVGGDIANVGSRSGFNYGRPNLVGNPRLDNPTATQWYNGAAFVKPVNSYGNSGRNILRVDDVFNTDLSLFKTIPVQERKELQLRFEAFNVFNHMDLGNPLTRIDQPNTGRITTISHMPRQLQLGLRFVF
jgi:outer membrane receptor protein involved in Fe transport